MLCYAMPCQGERHRRAGGQARRQRQGQPDGRVGGDGLPCDSNHADCRIYASRDGCRLQAAVSIATHNFHLALVAAYA